MWDDVPRLERGSKIPDEFGEKTTLQDFVGKRSVVVKVCGYIEMGKNDDGRDYVAVSVETREGKRLWFFTSSEPILRTLREIKPPFVARLTSRISQKRKGARYYAFEPPEEEQ